MAWPFKGGKRVSLEERREEERERLLVSTIFARCKIQSANRSTSNLKIVPSQSSAHFALLSVRTEEASMKGEFVCSCVISNSGTFSPAMPFPIEAGWKII